MVSTLQADLNRTDVGGCERKSGFRLVGGEQREGIMQLHMKWFEHAPIFKSSSEGPVAKKNHPAFVEFLLSEGKLVLWVTIQQKSASLYNFSTKVNIYLPSRPK